MSGKSAKMATAKIRSVLAWDASLESNPSMSAKVWVSRDTQILVTGGVEMGKRCWIERTVPADGEDGEDTVPIRRQATLTSSLNKKIHSNVVMMTEAYRKACGFKLGDVVTIVAHDDLDVPPAETVQVEPLEPMQSDYEMRAWEGSVWTMLKKMTYVVPGLNFEVNVVGYTTKYVVKSIDGKTDGIARFDEKVKVRIQNASADDAESPADIQPRGKLVLHDSDIPGMPQQVKQLNEFFRRFNKPPIHIGPRKSCGIVVHGGQNSGKTHVLERIAATNWGRVFRITEPKPSDITKIFQEALEASPSIVLIDDLHTMVRKEKANSESIVRKLCEQLDDLSSKSQRIGKTLPVLVVASCLSYKGDIPMQLEKSTRFGPNVMLVTPHTHGRRLMLEELCKPLDIAEREEALQWLAHNTYAYNMGDLSALVDEAIEVCQKRVDPDDLEVQLGHDDRKDLPLTLADLERARRLTRPTAMQDVHLQPPTIHWNDIGGQDELKAMLQRQINMTKNTDPRLKELMLAPPKGLILYGPPGCSKTLLAQAVATESGFSFLAIKGAELLNMYVGESERALRELFERARAVSPSIIFFDEIDSMGGNRTGGGTRSQGNVNMLTTLLTEMDGFETLTGVFILAATNRPETLDPALLRPGRFGQHVYVGLPNQQAREAIIRMNMGRLRTEELDIPALAKLAEGFTGAEMQQACFKATERVLDGYLDGKKSIEESMVTMGDITAAIQHTVRGVSQEMLDGYTRFGQRSGKPAQAV